MGTRACLAFLFASASLPALASAPCHMLDKTKFPNGTEFTILTAGQTHFAQGAFSATPPVGAPGGDGAMLIMPPSKKMGAIAFTDGPLICEIMGVGPEFIAILLRVPTGEIGKPSGEEL